MRSKKGFLVLIIAAAFLFVALVEFMFYSYIAKPASLNFGEDQLAILSLYQEGEKALIYADYASLYSLEKAASELPGQGGYAYGSPCGEYHGFAVWNSLGRNCIPNEAMIAFQLGALANEHLADYFSSYSDAGLLEINYYYSIDERDSAMLISGYPDKQLRFFLNQQKTPKEGFPVIGEYDEASSYQEPDTPAVSGEYSGKGSAENDELIAYFGTHNKVESQLKNVTMQGKKIYVHAKALAAFELAAKNLRSTGYVIHGIGSYEWGFIQGTNDLSWHSFGIAVDINPVTNPACGSFDPLNLCTADKNLVTDMPQEVVDAFVDAGFAWGGSWQHPSPAHFQWEGWRS